MIIIGFIQFERVIVVAENIYRNIHIALNDNTLVIDNGFEAIPIEVDNLAWVGEKDRRVGTKYYTDIYEAENELSINMLENTMRYKSTHQRDVPFIYFEESQIAKLLFSNYIIGDLENYNETLLENGDWQSSNSIDKEAIYKSPVSMSVMFFTESGENHQLNNLDQYNYEEKYTSPSNNITAYLLKGSFQFSSSDETLLSYAADTITDKITVFVHDNLFYTISGDIPSSEMKKIIDSFVIEK